MSNVTNETLVLVVTLAGDEGSEAIVSVATNRAVLDAFNATDDGSEDTTLIDLALRGDSELLKLAVGKVDSDDYEDSAWVIVNVEEIDPRVAALAEHLGLDADDYSEIDDEGDNTFSYGREEYKVLTDSEADEACAEEIGQSLWAFNADFLAGETGIDSEVFTALAELYERANDAVRKLIGDDDDYAAFVKSATSADGRGHFLAGYDHNENEEGDFYIYRTN